jgi:hypothetical protein
MARRERQCGFGKTRSSRVVSLDTVSILLFQGQLAGNLPIEDHREKYPSFPLPNRRLIVSASRLGIALTHRKQTTDTISNRRQSWGMCNIPFAPAQIPLNSLKNNGITSFPASAKARSVVSASDPPFPRSRRTSPSVYPSWTAHIPNSPLKASQ